MLLREVHQAACTALGVAVLISCSSGGDDHVVATGGSTSNAAPNLGMGGVGATSSIIAAGDSTGGRSSSTMDIHANVTAVLVQGAEESYVFSVSVESSDIDCSQYADWWEVLTEDGALLYRRILNHCHTDANGTSDPNAPGNTFTRSSDPDTVPLGASQVAIVRAHMNVAGYCGMAMRGTPAGGFNAAPEIGPNFFASVEHEDPQPTGCLF